MAQNNLKIAVIIACIVSMAISGCARKGKDQERKKLTSAATVYRIVKDTEIQDIAFVFVPKDFIRIVVIQHAFFDPLDVVFSPFEVRGILNEKTRKTFTNFADDNIDNKIKVTINNQAVTPGAILKEAIDYVPLGCYFSKEKALKAAQQLSYEPEFEDWREREHIEQDVLKKEMLQY